MIPKTNIEQLFKPFILTAITGGQIAFLRGHISKSDESIKDRKFHMSTHAGKRQMDLDAQALNPWTALDLHPLILAETGIDIPPAAITAALRILDDKVKTRKAGNAVSGPKVTIPVAVDANGRTVIQAIQNQKTGEWSLSLGPVEQVWTKTIKAGIIDHKAEAIRKLAKCADSALKQADKWTAQAVKTQSLSSVCTLINKVIPRERGPDIRRLTLIGKGSINCDSISIGGQVFTDMFSVVATFRPDLSDLFTQ